MGGGSVLVFQEVGTKKSLHWRCGLIASKCGLIASNERDVQSFLSLQRLIARSLPRRRSRRTCVR